MSLHIDDGNSSSELDAVLKVISNLVRKSASGEYIYRGEAKRFCKVSSSLYRQFKEIESESFDVEEVQKEILKEAEKFIPEAVSSEESNPIEVLTQLQHYGGKTNLIDFTADYLIALFFACDGFSDKDGRVILVSKTGPTGRHIKYAPNVNNRVSSQKSVFVQPTKGFVTEYEEIKIHSHLKPSFLNYLRNAHNISTESIYNDIFGFIRYREVHRSAYTEFYRGLTYQSKNEDTKAVARYSESIELNSQALSSYINRGICYIDTGEVDLAIKDFDRVIEINPGVVDAYISRGVAYRDKGNLDLAIEDYDRALELKPNNSSALSNRGSAYSDKGLSALAMRDHNKAIELEPESASCYVNRGFAYNREGAHGLAIEDYNKALELDSGKATARYNRGEAWLCLAEWEKARSDLIAARDAGEDIVSSFHSEYESILRFEQRFNLKIPEDLAEMLGG